MSDTVRWSLKVSRETDISLRTYLARQGMRKGDLSRFVERAVRKEVFASIVGAVKARNADKSVAEMEAIIHEALEDVRADTWNAENRGEQG